MDTGNAVQESIEIEGGAAYRDIDFLNMHLDTPQGSGRCKKRAGAAPVSCKSGHKQLPSSAMPNMPAGGPVHGDRPPLI